MAAPAFDPSAPSEDVPPFDPGAESEDVATGAPAEKRSFLGDIGSRIKKVGSDIAAPFVNATLPASAADAWERVKQNAPILGRQFVSPLASAASGINAVGHAIAHPIDTFGDGKAGSVAREAVRGVQGSVPLLGLANEHLTGFPEYSPEDAKAAPGWRDVGGMLAAPIVAKGAPEVIPEARAAANAVQDAIAEGSDATLARSVARRAEDATPVRTAIKDLGDEVQKHGMRHGGLAWAGHTIGGPTGAAIGAGISLAKPVLKAAFTAADEGLAAIARRAVTPVGDVAEAGSPATAAEIADVVSPNLEILHNGLKTATPEQAADIKKAIEGIKARAAVASRAVGPEEAPAASEATAVPSPGEASAPDASAPVVDHRIAAMRAALATASPAQAEFIKGALSGLEAKIAREMAGKPLPEIESPGPVSRGPTVPIKPENFGGRPSNVSRPEPVWSPSDADHRFARQLGISTEKYRIIMAEREAAKGSRPSREDLGEQFKQRVVEMANQSPSAERFAKQAGEAGVSPTAARRIWDAAHDSEDPEEVAP